METLEIGNGLVALCREGKHLEAIETYYSNDIVSIEGASNPEMAQTMEGIDAIKGKNQWWIENHEVHSSAVQGPFCAEGDTRFGAVFEMDVTFKPSGERTQMTEIALYEVADGKIVEERFFYNMGG